MSGEPYAPLDGSVPHHLVIQSKIEEMAEQAGIPAQDRLTLDALLKALPQPERWRVKLFLEGVKAQSNSQVVQQAADEYLALAATAWGR